MSRVEAFVNVSAKSQYDDELPPWLTLPQPAQTDDQSPRAGRHRNYHLKHSDRPEALDAFTLAAEPGVSCQAAQQKLSENSITPILG